MGQLFLFETLLDNNSQIFQKVPESEEGEANKETESASNVRYQRDNVVVDHLMFGQNASCSQITHFALIPNVFIVVSLTNTWICGTFTSVLTETETEA